MLTTPNGTYALHLSKYQNNSEVINMYFFAFALSLHASPRLWKYFVEPNVFIYR